MTSLSARARSFLRGRRFRLCPPCPRRRATPRAAGRRRRCRCRRRCCMRRCCRLLLHLNQLLCELRLDFRDLSVLLRRKKNASVSAFPHIFPEPVLIKHIDRFRVERAQKTSVFRTDSKRFASSSRSALSTLAVSSCSWTCMGDREQSELR